MGYEVDSVLASNKNKVLQKIFTADRINMTDRIVGRYSGKNKMYYFNDSIDFSVLR
jgi:hypothetical protein